jgi:hypothetical protein
MLLDESCCGIFFASFWGKMALPVILCCVIFIFAMSHIFFRHLGGATLFWVVRYLLLGDRALFIMF